MHRLRGFFLHTCSDWRRTNICGGKIYKIQLNKMPDRHLSYILVAVIQLKVVKCRKWNIIEIYTIVMLYVLLWWEGGVFNSWNSDRKNYIHFRKTAAIVNYYVINNLFHSLTFISNQRFQVMFDVCTNRALNLTASRSAYNFATRSHQALNIK